MAQDNYSPEDCYEAIIAECTQGLIALGELRSRPYSDRKKTLETSSYLIESWVSRLKDSV